MKVKRENVRKLLQPHSFLFPLTTIIYTSNFVIDKHEYVTIDKSELAYIHYYNEYWKQMHIFKSDIYISHHQYFAHLVVRSIVL